MNVTTFAPVRFVPVIVTAVPAPPEAGAKLVIVGASGGGGVVFPPPQSASRNSKAERIRPAKRCPRSGNVMRFDWRFENRDFRQE